MSMSPQAEIVDSRPHEPCFFELRRWRSVFVRWGRDKDGGGAFGMAGRAVATIGPKEDMKHFWAEGFEAKFATATFAEQIPSPQGICGKLLEQLNN